MRWSGWLAKFVEIHGDGENKLIEIHGNSLKFVEIDRCNRPPIAGII